MDWKECFRRRIVKQVEPDENLISSLIKTSGNKLKSSEELKTNEVNAVSKISLAYDSLREILEALSLKNGYKIYNHECHTCFIKEILNESGGGDDFDEIRKIRNDLNYYAKEISVEEAEEVIKRIKNLRKLFLSMLIEF